MGSHLDPRGPCIGACEIFKNAIKEHGINLAAKKENEREKERERDKANRRTRR